MGVRFWFREDGVRSCGGLVGIVVFCLVCRDKVFRMGRDRIFVWRGRIWILGWSLGCFGILGICFLVMVLLIFCFV